MPTKIFVNLPVKDLGKSIDFFTGLGFSFNSQFTDENATCMVISDDIYAMLLVEPFFKSFTNKDIVDSTKRTEVILALEVEGRERVDELVGKALAAGGQSGIFSSDDGFMYARSFQDVDEHLWEVLYMDPAALQEHASASGYSSRCRHGRRRSLQPPPGDIP
jgi:uncharacterized protein